MARPNLSVLDHVKETFYHDTRVKTSTIMTYPRYSLAHPMNLHYLCNSRSDVLYLFLLSKFENLVNLRLRNKPSCTVLLYSGFSLLALLQNSYDR